MLTLSRVHAATRRQCQEVLQNDEFAAMLHNIDTNTAPLETLRKRVQQALEQQIRNRKCAEMRVWFVDEFSAYRFTAIDSLGNSLAEDWLLSATIRNAIAEACNACDIPIDEEYFAINHDGLEATWVCDLEGI